MGALKDPRGGGAETMGSSDQQGRLGVIFVGLPPSFALDLAAQARCLGYRTGVAAGLVELPSAFEAGRPPDAAVVNLDLAESDEILVAVATQLPTTEIAAITGTPSIVRVAEAVRRGARTVLARPATFGQILAALDLKGGRDGKPKYMSLDRVIWEYLNQTILEAGSISEAARRLRLDRTSLRRMLRKIPPLR
jgi:ActR/RegA family two-component response regulator